MTTTNIDFIDDKGYLFLTFSDYEYFNALFLKLEK